MCVALARAACWNGKRNERGTTTQQCKKEKRGKSDMWRKSEKQRRRMKWNDTEKNTSWRVEVWGENREEVSLSLSLRKSFLMCLVYLEMENKLDRRRTKEEKLRETSEKRQTRDEMGWLEKFSTTMMSTLFSLSLPRLETYANEKDTRRRKKDWNIECEKWRTMA